MKTIVTTLVGTLILLTCLCCASQLSTDLIRPLAANADTARIGLATFVLETLNDKGEAVATFKEGQNVILSFTISNKDSKPLLINYWDFPVSNADFFRVDQRTAEGKKPLGKSFRLGANTRDLIPQTIPANSTVVYQAPWLVKNSFFMPQINGQSSPPFSRLYMPTDTPADALKVGNYSSGFTLDINDKPLTMSIAFTVE